MPPDPPRGLHLWHLRCQEKLHVRSFHNYVHYFTKLLKTMVICGQLQLHAI